MPLINVENWISIFENFELPVGLYELGTTIIVFINLYFICGVSTGTLLWREVSTIADVRSFQEEIQAPKTSRHITIF